MGGSGFFSPLLRITAHSLQPPVHARTTRVQRTKPRGAEAAARQWGGARPVGVGARGPERSSPPLRRRQNALGSRGEQRKAESCARSPSSSSFLKREHATAGARHDRLAGGERGPPLGLGACCVGRWALLPTSHMHTSTHTRHACNEIFTATTGHIFTPPRSLWSAPSLYWWSFSSFSSAAQAAAVGSSRPPPPRPRRRRPATSSAPAACASADTPPTTQSTCPPRATPVRACECAGRRRLQRGRQRVKGSAHAARRRATHTRGRLPQTREDRKTDTGETQAARARRGCGDARAETRVVRRACGFGVRTASAARASCPSAAPRPLRRARE